MLVVVATGALIGVTALPASAGTSQSGCTAPYWYWGTRQCTTGAVSANPSGHYVDLRVSVCAGVPWKVWDTANNVVVSSGIGSTQRRISGLYGEYRAQIWTACAWNSVTLSSY